MNEASPNDSRFPSETLKKLRRHAAKFTAAGSLARNWYENPNHQHIARAGDILLDYLVEAANFERKMRKI